MSKKIIYRILQILCLIYVVIPEATDLIPIIGWLDEATAIGFVVYLQKKIKEMDKKEEQEEVIEIK